MNPEIGQQAKPNTAQYKLWLAPMEGVVDYILRDFMGEIGGLDYSVTEFIRVTNQLLPESVFYRYCPELKSSCQTASGLPVHVQLLGGEALPMAENAARVVELGATAIDLNFGCPAKTVNRHDGGAVLLNSPERLYNIVSHVRKSVPAHVPVTAKIRLGFADPAHCLENAPAIAAAGAAHITVHCRTKMNMYQPPAYWDWIPKMKALINIPVIANGEIWNVQDLKNCAAVTGCDQFMIGRGALRDPLIFAKIKGLVSESSYLPLAELLRFYELNQKLVSPYFATARTKQWLRNMVSVSPQLADIFSVLKLQTVPTEFHDLLRKQVDQVSPLQHH